MQIASTADGPFDSYSSRQRTKISSNSSWGGFAPPRAESAVISSRGSAGSFGRPEDNALVAPGARTCDAHRQSRAALEVSRGAIDLRSPSWSQDAPGLDGEP